MPSANLLQALSKNPKEGVRNILLFGRVRCLIEKPNIISYIKPSSEGAFAILDVFALKCLRDDYFSDRGTVNRDHIYNTKGSVIFYLNKPSLVGRYVKVSGKTAAGGVTVKQNVKHTSPSDGVVAFAWSKGSDGWLLEPNMVSELAENDPNIAHVPFLEYVLKYIGKNTEIEEYPVSNIIEFEGIADYKEIDPMGVRGVEDSVHHSDGRIDLSKVDLKLTYHDKGVEAPEFFFDVKDEIEVQARKRHNFVKGVVDDIKKGYEKNVEVIMNACQNIKRSFIENVVCNYTMNVGRSNIKGRVYLEDFLKALQVQGFDEKDRKTEKEVGVIREKVLENPYSLGETDVLNISDTRFASMVVGLSTGIGFEGMMANFRSVKRAADMKPEMWFYMLLSNPYFCSILGSGISTIEADVIWYSYTKNFAQGIADTSGSHKMRNRLVYLSVLDDLSQDDSIVPKRNIKNDMFRYGGKRFLDVSAFPAKKDTVELLRVICGADLALSARDKALLTGDSWFYGNTSRDLIDNGIVNEIDDGLIIEMTLEKEALIFEVFQKKGMEETGITQEQCDKVCTEFEESSSIKYNCDFKLEELQKKGISLIRFKSAVLTGCAGSGKTTTSDGMVMGLEEYLKGYKLVYCAPTGKAARRMAEVLGRSVKTVHSEFKISVGVKDGYLGRVSRRGIGGSGDEVYKGKIYLIDESGMLNRELLYEVARSIKNEDLVYFLGDIKQLPPIGTGCPFYNLMAILPCVELGVSKRAAANSLVNYNTTVINCLSEGVMEGVIFDDDTFVCVDCSNEAISSNILGLWKRFMSEGKKEDDIQVITAYASDKFLYSSTNLNPILQKYLRKGDAHCFRYAETDFFKGDRVIHANSNIYGMQRFVKVGPMQYEEVLSLGVVNGELGKIVGCYDSRNYTITELEVDEDGESEDIVAGEGFYSNCSEEGIKEMSELRKTYRDSIESLSTKINEYTWFVEMEVYDVTLRRPVSIFYEGRVHNQDGIIMLSGGLLGNIELAYALTCHKMQGSQIPIALIPIGSDANPDFVNRNMLNTMITRSQGIVGLLGDISANDSAFNRGRRKVAKYRNDSILTTLSEDARG